MDSHWTLTTPILLRRALHALNIAERHGIENDNGLLPICSSTSRVCIWRFCFGCTVPHLPFIIAAPAGLWAAMDSGRKALGAGRWAAADPLYTAREIG